MLEQLLKWNGIMQLSWEQACPSNEKKEGVMDIYSEDRRSSSTVWLVADSDGVDDVDAAFGDEGDDDDDVNELDCSSNVLLLTADGGRKDKYREVVKLKQIHR